ncbi:MAG: right-handed parallel beta-helix repeat-containing protein [Deltaproteobacteria bacterium]|nr:right-handed parallel beta-helix repeat-containing protein [Deltaproteobacteria bacterium]
MPTSRRLALLVCVTVCFAVAPAHAATLLVAGNGVDTPDCGTKTSPCRSISRAVALAGQGDTIQVGPGRYGDLAQDGSFTAPGDEAAEVGTGCNCMLHVTKRVTIVSRDGAGATVLDAGGVAIDVVRLDAAATVFGKKGQGFTLAGGGVDGLRTNADMVVIAGNVAVGNADDGIAVSAQHVTVTDNRALANGNAGIRCSGTNDSTFARNVATDNAEFGIEADNRNVFTDNLASQNGGNGFVAQNGNTLKGDVALGNASTGFVLNEGNGVTGCVAHANHNGFRLGGQGNTLTKSAVLDNFGVGITAIDAGNAVTKTSVFGNGGGAVNVPGANINCGTLTSDGVTLQATRNFWGSTAGPGADPADLACNGVGATTNVLPVATKDTKVRAPAAR